MESPLTPPHQEDEVTNIIVHIPAEIAIVNGESSYWIANKDIEEMDIAELREQLRSLMNDAK